MLFNSAAFAVFLPIVFSVYWLLPHRFRWILLLISSYCFYMSWNPRYLFLIVLTTSVSYVAGLLMENKALERWRKLLLIIAGVICLGILFFFKYYNFFQESITAVLRLFSIPVNSAAISVLLPVGISFYTFQTLSYVVDVYRGTIRAERHFGIYATFISFFPQLVAGPIERAENLLPQIREQHCFQYKQASNGLKLMAWGFFKKIVVADGISIYVSKVYNAPRQYIGFTFVLTALLFAIQIYCDFSGYSDIASGTAKLFGIELMANFKSPYFSQSIKEFWSRWHISLSSWFKDYVYIPLGGNRVGKLRHCINLMVIFLLSGLWHGANWTFVLWGAMHGIAQVAERFLISGKREPSKNHIDPVRTGIVFAFTAFAWIFFASDTVDNALYMMSHLLSGITSPVAYLRNGFAAFEFIDADLLSIISSVLLLSVYDYASLKMNVIEWISQKKTITRWCIYVLFMLFFILMLPFSTSTEFIYFQF